MASEAPAPLRRSKQHHKNNFLIHQLYLRQVLSSGHLSRTSVYNRSQDAVLQDLDDCLLLVDRTLAETQETAEYALYIKSLIHRQKGAVPSLSLTAATRPSAPNKTLVFGRPVVRLSSPVSKGSCCQPQQLDLSEAGKACTAATAC